MTTGDKRRRKYAFPPSHPDSRRGLTSAEVQARRDGGAINREPPESSHSYKKILRDNIFTLFNCINLVLAAAVVLAGHPRNAIFFGVAVCNTVMGIVQEARAKRALDKLTVIASPYARVIRDGRESRIPRGDVVIDDVIVFAAGDQMCVDAAVIESFGFEVDESALTGESENLEKRKGDTLLSGSLAVAGRAVARATAVGEDSWAHALAAEAKRRKKNETQLTRAINGIIRVLSFAIVPIGTLLFVKNLGSGAARATLGAAAAAIGMIPEGLALLTGVTLTLGAIRLAKKEALVQSLPCIETLARTDILCLDKTGTITDGTLVLEGVEPVSAEMTREQAKRALFWTVAATGDDNATARAILAGLNASASESPRRVAFTPFSSKRKWCSATFAADSGSGDAASEAADEIAGGVANRVASGVAGGVATEISGWVARNSAEETMYVLGAPSFVAAKSLEDDASFRDAVKSRAGNGLRVMVLARAAGRGANGARGSGCAEGANGANGADGADGEIGENGERGNANDMDGASCEISANGEIGTDGSGKLPSDLTPIALVTLQDTLRPDARGSFDYFASEGVEIKVISGDDPLTVSAVAHMAGIAGADKWIDMSSFEKSGEAPDITELALSRVVFGRVSPSQKRDIVAALKATSKTVCMIGDGVNDVLAMKEANCGIALGEGADAARGAADIVLLGRGFAAMRETLYEGRRVINNIERVASLYLIKTIWSAALAAIFLALPMPYPFAPLQLTPINMFAVGIPTFFLALQRDTRKPLGRFYSNVFAHSIPAAAVIVVNVLLAAAFGAALSMDEKTVTAVRVILTGACGFFALFRVARPTGATGRAAFAALACLFAAALGLSWDFIGLGGAAPIGAVALLPLAASIPLQTAAYAAIARKIRELTARDRGLSEF